MTSKADLIPAPADLITEACELLEYGSRKDCADSRSLLDTLRQARQDYSDRPALPLPASLLHRLQQTLLTLCFHAGVDFPPGEKVVRFSRSADHFRVLLHTTATHDEDTDTYVTHLA
ncbi:hypothetical protein [Streptomyces sp. NPDC016845]|uniref:hypothetical protein n=1 Tax=Streptomyces sp. NPDC016845 TaxID=3364972 RepID=UPI00378D2048